jgi:competence protein ComEC
MTTATHCRRTIFAIAWLAGQLLAQNPSGLQLHFLDAGHADATLLITPAGEIIAFDLGKDTRSDCTKLLDALDQRRIDHIDYVILTHYHSDHIGCVPEVLSRYPLRKQALDRGATYAPAVFQQYLMAVGPKRVTAKPGQKLLLQQATPPVDVEIIALNGNGIPTTDENSLSITTRITYGAFHAEIGGDLTGDDAFGRKDIETSVAPKIGHLDVYKVHYHGSSHSSNNAWLEQTKPTIGIISVGENNPYGHPAADCLQRLHLAGVETYWTERGNGAPPTPTVDYVAGTITIDVPPNGKTFNVHSTTAPGKTYPVNATGTTPSGQHTTTADDVLIVEDEQRVGTWRIGAQVSPSDTVQREKHPFTSRDDTITLKVDDKRRIEEINVYRQGALTQRLISIGTSTIEDVLRRYGTPNKTASQEGKIELTYPMLRFRADNTKGNTTPVLRRPIDSISLAR